jgi:predicted ATPase/DNA-binding winged helix-turn-helix (wHTH) protein
VKLSEQIVFPPFRLDPVNEQLWREHQLVPLRPKTFAVLRFLVEHAGRLVTKEELLKGVWPDTHVSGGIVKGHIRDLRDILGDDSQHPRFIETVPRRGHRFLPAVTPQPVPSSQSPVLSSGKAEQEPSQLMITDNWQLTTHLVGRNAELAHLHSLFVKALRGERQMVFVTGEAGIGKTTLVETFLQSLEFSVQRLASENHDVSPLQTLDPRLQTLDSRLWIGRGQCVEQHGAGEAYLPVLEALSRIGRSPGGEQLVTILQQYAPTWLVQMPALLTVEELETLQRRVVGATRERMLREIVEALEVLTAQRPLVLWFEDLHWADASTVDWLAAIARQSAAARLLVIGTYRPSDLSLRNHPLRAVKQELVAKGQSEELLIPFLSVDDVTQYLKRRYDQHQFPSGLGAAIHRRTDGNPLFVVNMVEYLVAQGMIAVVDGHWRLQTTLEEVGRGVPDSLRQLIEKHIERLSEEQQRLLEVASVVGVMFSTAAVAAGIEAPVEQVEEWCEGLAKRGQFLQAQEPRVLPDGTMCGSYKFLHPLYQAVPYERIPAMRRLRLHRRVGDWEEQIYGVRTHEIAA